MPRSQIHLEILKLLLSPQMIGGACVLIFIFCFRSEVKALLGRVAKISFAGAEVDMTQAQRLESAEKPQPAQLTLSLAAGAKEEQPIDAAALRERLGAERARAATWEYRYLNYFLASVLLRK